MLSFLNDAEDSNGAPEAETQIPEESTEETTADEVDLDGAQEEPTDAEDQEVDSEDDDESEFIELDGQEITLDQIRDWQKGTMREQDYTKKTQALAEDRKALEARTSELDSSISNLASAEEDFKNLLVADLDDIDLKQLRETDYVEYKKLTEDIESRKAKFDELKSKAVDERKKLQAAGAAELGQMMGWDDSGKRETDVKVFGELISELGFTECDSATLTSPKVAAALIELAHIKKAAKAPVPKPRSKRVNISKRSKSASTPKTAPTTQAERIDNFFD